MSQQQTTRHSDTTTLSPTHNGQINRDAFLTKWLDITKIEGKPIPRVDTKISLKKCAVDLAPASKKIVKPSSTGNATSANEPREINKLLSYEERIHIIHMHENLRMSENEISKMLGMKYVTIRAIIKMWKDTGRINKLLPYSSKKQLLKNRELRHVRLGRP